MCSLVHVSHLGISFFNRCSSVFNQIQGFKQCEAAVKFQNLGKK